MDPLLKQVGELLLGAIPTAVILLLLYALYTNLVGKPLKKVLEQRRERTEGAVLKARADIAAAEAKTHEYEQRLRDAWLAPPLDAELGADDLAALRATGRAIRVAPTLHFHPDAIAEGRRRIVELAGGPGGSVTLAQVRDALGSSRKFATALLAHLDSTRVTVRRGDEHVVRRTR